MCLTIRIYTLWYNPVLWLCHDHIVDMQYFIIGDINFYCQIAWDIYFYCLTAEMYSYFITLLYASIFILNIVKRCYKITGS